VPTTKECADLSTVVELVDFLHGDVDNRVVGTNDFERCLEDVRAVHLSLDENIPAVPYDEEYAHLRKLIRGVSLMDGGGEYIKSHVYIGSGALHFGVLGMKEKAGLPVPTVRRILVNDLTALILTANNAPLVHAYFYDVLFNRLQIDTLGVLVSSLKPDWTEGAAHVYAGLIKSNDAKTTEEYTKDIFKLNSTPTKPVRGDMETPLLLMCADQDSEEKCNAITVAKGEGGVGPRQCTWSATATPKCQRT